MPSLCLTQSCSQERTRLSVWLSFSQMPRYFSILRLAAKTKRQIMRSKQFSFLYYFIVAMIILTELYHMQYSLERQ